MVRFGVLISGSGTNLQAVIDAIAAGTLDAQVPIVVSSRPDAYGIERARAVGIETLVLSREAYADPRAADARIVEALQRAGCDYVVMAGYMRKVTDAILMRFPTAWSTCIWLCFPPSRARTPSRTPSTPA